MRLDYGAHPTTSTTSGELVIAGFGSNDDYGANLASVAIAFR